MHATCPFTFPPLSCSIPPSTPRSASHWRDPVYSRLTNPTVEVLENRIASLEGGVHAVAFASGQAAETAAILNLAQAGDHIVASPRLYGGTETLLLVTLPKLGITTTFVENPDDPESWQAAVEDNTVAFYGETFANPQADVLDIPAIAEVAHKNNVPLIVDNTLATAALVRPSIWALTS